MSAVGAGGACAIPTGAQLGECGCADCAALLAGIMAVQERAAEETERLFAKHPVGPQLRDLAIRQAHASLGVVVTAGTDNEIAFPAKNPLGT